ncbi:MAG: nitroreductase/quinone reductase family protein [Pseudomonadales bacterium]
MIFPEARQHVQSSFFRQLNNVVEPLVKAGVGSPGCLPTGLIVLETIGRKSGQIFNVPVMATVIDDALLIGTVRGQSQWVKNLAATNEIRYWFKGEAQDGTASVFLPNSDSDSDERGFSPLVEKITQGLQAINKLSGGSFAILRPQDARY